MYRGRNCWHANGVSVSITIIILSTSLLFLSINHGFFANSYASGWLQTGTTEQLEVLPDDESTRSLLHVLHPEEHAGRESPTTWNHRWQITAGIRAPDGVQKRVYLINEAFPGPTIEARSGDTIVVEVVNCLEGDEGVSIHWHGLHLPNAMDGVVGYTQDATPPNSSFTYAFTIEENQSGTFWYHSHSREQIGDGLWGALIIHKPVEVMDEKHMHGYGQDLLLMIGDWYHHPAEDLFQRYLHWSRAGAEPVPDSLLVNGLGHFECSKLEQFLNNDSLECSQQEAPQLRLDLEKKYRLRVINTG